MVCKEAVKKVDSFALHVDVAPWLGAAAGYERGRESVIVIIGERPPTNPKARSGVRVWRWRWGWWVVGDRRWEARGVACEFERTVESEHQAIGTASPHATNSGEVNEAMKRGEG